MITLHTFGPMLGVPDPSPFCIKAMALLKMSGLPFEVVPGADPRKAPKGKIPWDTVTGGHDGARRCRRAGT